MLFKNQIFKKLIQNLHIKIDWSNKNKFKMARVNDQIQKLFDKNYEDSKAVTFDEVTFEDKPSTLHPNEVVLTTQLTRKYELK